MYLCYVNTDKQNLAVMKTLETLSENNIKNAYSVINRSNPDYGIKRVNIEPNGWSIGVGENTSTLDENDFQLYDVVCTRSELNLKEF